MCGDPHWDPIKPRLFIKLKILRSYAYFNRKNVSILELLFEIIRDIGNKIGIDIDIDTMLFTYELLLQ